MRDEREDLDPGAPDVLHAPTTAFEDALRETLEENADAIEALRLT